jgi:hypothetical protein
VISVPVCVDPANSYATYSQGGTPRSICHDSFGTRYWPMNVGFYQSIQDAIDRRYSPMIFRKVIDRSVLLADSCHRIDLLHR